MGQLSDCVKQNKLEIEGRLHIGYANWDDLVGRIERQERKQEGEFYDEQVWTFLVGCAYALAPDGPAQLARALIGATASTQSEKIWFEVLPSSPRVKEGQSHIDFALGSIRLRPGTQSGIQYAPNSTGDVIFCECKWYSDIDTKVGYDQHRNQLARIIDNACCFQASGRFPDRIHVVLITPRSFKQRNIKSRLYQYKFGEYQSDPDLLPRN